MKDYWYLPVVFWGDDLGAVELRVLRVLRDLVTVVWIFRGGQLLIFRDGFGDGDGFGAVGF